MALYSVPTESGWVCYQGILDGHPEEGKLPTLSLPGGKKVEYAPDMGPINHIGLTPDEASYGLPEPVWRSKVKRSPYPIGFVSRPLPTWRKGLRLVGLTGLGALIYQLTRSK